MRALVLLGFVLSGFVVGCGDHGTTTPEDLSRYEGPIASTDVEAGSAVFQASCNGCHPGGGAGAGPSLTANPHSPAELRRQIREGSSRMPDFSETEISPEALEALLAFAATVGAVE